MWYIPCNVSPGRPPTIPLEPDERLMLLTAGSFEMTERK
jgi:hypothetical protein